MDLGKSSKPTITVAPVVVNAETDSNTASTKEICNSLENIKGADPERPNTVQNKTTTKKPSRKRQLMLRDPIYGLRHPLILLFRNFVKDLVQFDEFALFQKL